MHLSQKGLSLEVCLYRICANIGLRSTAKASGQAAQHISKMVGGLILLKEVLQVLPSLARHLEGADSQLLQAIGANCNHEVFKRILDKTVQLLDEVTSPWCTVQ